MAGRVPWLVTSRAPSVHAPLAQTALAMAAARAAVSGTTIITIAELLARPRVALHLLLAGGKTRLGSQVEAAGIETLQDGGLVDARLLRTTHLLPAEAARVRQRAVRCACECDGLPSFTDSLSVTVHIC